MISTNSTYILEKLSKEISYRVQRCEEVWNEGEPLKKFTEFKAFIFSIGNAMDLVRVHLFKDFPPKGRYKYFKDLFDRDKKNLSEEFEKYLKEKITGQKVPSGIIKAFNRIRSIFFDEKYKGFCRKKLEEKDFHLWKIYNSLKHTSVVEKSHIIASFTNDIIGTSGDIMIEIFFGKNLYELHFPGKPVAPEGVKPEDFGYSSENQTLIWIRSLGQKIIEFLESLKELLKLHSTKPHSST
ncbi:MAG TPA: hypothetical protein ENF81_08455 [Thermotogaceae bacterium]|nr:hypothetical protein [Thermotogaceae bacterium]